MNQKFLFRWALYPLRSLFYRHWKKLILAAVAAVLAYLFVGSGVVFPHAADTTNVVVDTSGLNSVAEAISSNAQVIDDFVDTMDLTAISSVQAQVSGVIDASMSGLPIVVVAVGIFIVVFIVFRKVIGR